MKTLVIKSESALVNPPPNTPIFSSIGMQPLAYFNAGLISSENSDNSPVKLPFSVSGSAPANQRIFDTSNSAKPPTFLKANPNSLSFDGTQGLSQTSGLILKRGFTLAFVGKFNEFKDLSVARAFSIGVDANSRNYVGVSSKGITVVTGDTASAYVDTAKSSDVVCLVIKFNGENSKYIGGDGALKSIQLPEMISQETSTIRIGMNVAGATAGGFNGLVYGFSLYQDNLTDDQLLTLHAEAKLDFGIL